MLETASRSDILTPVSNTQSNGDTNGNSILPRNDIDYGAIVEPQTQITTCTQSLPIFHDRLQDVSYSAAKETILKATESRPPTCKDGEHDFDGRVSIVNSATNLIASSNQPMTFPDTETPPIIRNCATSDVAAGE